jgi:hypothetical protein
MENAVIANSMEYFFPLINTDRNMWNKIIMRWFELDIIANDFFLGIAASLIAAVIYSLLIKVYTYTRYLVKEKGKNAEIAGYWIVSFSNRYTSNKQAVEIFKFERINNLEGYGTKFRFKYQHFNNVRYIQKPLLGGGVALSKGEQISGIYGFDEEPIVLGNFLIKADSSMNGRLTPRFMGSYYEFDDQRINQTQKNKYIFYKIDLPLWKRIKFIFSRPCMKDYEEAYGFFRKHKFHKLFSDTPVGEISSQDE